jgi:serine protease AprX
VDFAPSARAVGALRVGPDVAWVSASASTTSTVAVVLIDPDGNQYGSAIGIPAPIVGNDGEITTGAPGKAGRWYVTVRGIGSVSGTDVDPPTSPTVRGTGHGVGTIPSSTAAATPAWTMSPPSGAAGNRVRRGVSPRRMAIPTRPSAPMPILKRSELAQYLLMGQSVRQSLPFSRQSSFTDLRAAIRATRMPSRPSRRVARCATSPRRRTA